MKLKKIVIPIFILGVSSWLYAGDGSSMNDIKIWLALFALAIIGIFILFFFSRESKKLQELHLALFEKQLEMEKNQNILLTTMSEKIQNIAKEAIEESKDIINNPTNIDHKEEIISNVENRLLHVTNDLIDFLRLKSKKVEIVHEEFNINNVLNEVAGNICTKFVGSSCELIFDMDKNIPRNIIGDSLHIGQILEGILEYQMDQINISEVKLELSMFETHGNNVEIQFNISDTGLGLTSDEKEKLFTPYYDEERGSYVGLGLFIANELAIMMNGKLSVQSIAGQGSIFILTLPLKLVSNSDKRIYKLPNKIISEKRVLLVDDNYNSALAIKKMFAYFKYEITLLTKDEFRKNIPNITPYDIVVLNESLFYPHLVEYLNKIKMGKTLKVIALNSLLKADKSNFVDDVIDNHLYKPLNQERIFELIVDLYNLKKPIDIKNNYIKNEQIKTIKTPILETRGITTNSFNDFKNKTLLIVEDNLVNQKVLTNLLSNSQMKIRIANNGQEAVDMVKDSKNKFDLVLMDINMPIMDGYTATQMIRLDHKYDNLPIVAFTALVLDSEMKKMFNSGINAFLAKPLNIGKLYTAMAIYFTDIKISKPLNDVVEDRVFEKYNGLNIENGIKRSNNSEALYMEVLREFFEAYGESGEVFKKLIDEHRYEQLKMLCIDMKGLSGAIGAFDMYELIVEILQHILYKKYELIANYKEKYIFEIDTLNKSINKYLSSH